MRFFQPSLCLLLYAVLMTMGHAAVWGRDAPGSIYPYSRPALVIDVEAFGADLEVKLGWNEVDSDPATTALLKVRSQGGEVVAQEVVVPLLSGHSTEIASGALSEIALHGLQYEVVLEDQLGKKLSDAMPVRIALHCAADGTCDFEAIPGIETDNSYWITPELAQALSGTSAESSDLWSTVLAMGESYRSPLYTHLLELELNEVIDSGGSGEPASLACDCIFTASSEFTGEPARGSGHLILSLANYYHQSEAMSGETSLEMDLFCFRSNGSRRGTTLKMPANQSILVGGQAVSPCDEPCDPTFRQRLNYAGHAWAVGEPGITGSSRTDLIYSINEENAVVESTEATKTETLVPGEADRLKAVRWRFGDVGTLNTSSEASVSSLRAPDEGSSGTRGEFDLVAYGELACQGIIADALLMSRQEDLSFDAEIELLGGEDDEDDGLSDGPSS